MSDRDETIREALREAESALRQAIRWREALSEIAAMHPADSGLRGGDVARAALREGEAATRQEATA